MKISNKLFLIILALALAILACSSGSGVEVVTPANKPAENSTSGNTMENSPSSTATIPTSSLQPTLPSQNTVAGFADSLQVLSTTLTAYWEGWCTVAGEVRNSSEITYSDIEIAVTLYDSAGIVIGADDTKLESIPPGKTFPFEIKLIHCLDNSDHVVGQVINAEVSAQEFIAIDSLEVLSTTLTAYWEGWCTVAGEVRNSSEITYSDIEIAVTLYDSAGIVIGADDTKLESIPPGKTFPFEIKLIHCLDNSDHVIGQVISFDE